MSQQRSDTLIYDGKTYMLKSATLADSLSNNLHRSSPIAPLLEANNLMQYFISPYLDFHSGNMRGYICDWKIEDGKLYLIAFSSRSIMIHTVNQLLGQEAPAKSPEYKAIEEEIHEIEEEFEKQYGSISKLKKEMQKLRQPFDDWSIEIIPKETKEAYDDMLMKKVVLQLEASSYMDESEVFAEWFSGSIEIKEHDDYNGQINGLCVEIVNGISVNKTPCHVSSYHRRPFKNYIED